MDELVKMDELAKMDECQRYLNTNINEYREHSDQ